MKTVPFDYRDSETGRRVRRWTDGTANDQHLYFTSPSVTSDDRWMVILSDRSGSPNLWAIDRETGRMRQLSSCEGVIHGYCYPEGGASGINKCSPFLDAERNIVYWLEDDRVMRCAIESGAAECLATVPAGWSGAFSHCSSDGSAFCIPLADRKAFYEGDNGQQGQVRSVAHRLIANGWHTKICVVDTATGELTVRAEVPFWVTHVQFQPGRNDRLLHNSEAMTYLTGDPHTRIWRIDENGRRSKLFDQPATMEVNHENFSHDGSVICYHGSDRRRSGPKPAGKARTWEGSYDPQLETARRFVEARTWEGELVWSADIGDTRLIHSTLMRDPRVCAIDDPDGLISILRLEDGDRFSLEPLCRHDTSWRNQDVHPHPIMIHSGEGIVFTSDREGSGNVYEVLLPDFLA